MFLSDLERMVDMIQRDVQDGNTSRMEGDRERLEEENGKRKETTASHKNQVKNQHKTILSMPLEP